LLEALGSRILRLFEELGRFFQMISSAFAWSVRPPWDVKELIRQMARVGVDSVPVVFLTTLFTGASARKASWEASSRSR
jgi:phospholipid/cholesterol/gamma-HCH transport system permease protein